MALALPRDQFYKAFLLVFIPVAILFDCLPLYPPSLVPTRLAELHAWYVVFFGDMLMQHHPTWFRFFSLVEFFFQVPCAVYVVHLLSCPSRSPRAPAVLLVFAVVSSFATATCVWDMYHDPRMTPAQWYMLGGMYSAYGVIFLVMAGDMFCRVQGALAAGVAGKKGR